MRATKDKKKKNISLEDYLHFFEEPTKDQKQPDLTADFLNQIIQMHGFKKIYNQPKKVLMEAISGVNLVNLSRSTVKEDNGDIFSISSCGFTDLEQIVADLNHLNWQECCVTSIQTIPAAAAAASSSSSFSSSSSVVRKRKRTAATREAPGHVSLGSF